MQSIQLFYINLHFLVTIGYFFIAINVKYCYNIYKDKRNCKKGVNVTMSIQNKDTQEKVLLDYMLIKYYAKRANLTINQLSDELGVTRQTIRSWTKKPTLIVNMWMLEDILEVKSGDLMADSL